MQDYQKTIISQYANSPSICRLIDLFNDYIDPAAEIQQFLTDVWDIDTCRGYGLDVWGKIVGVSRFLKVPINGHFFGFCGGDGQPFGQQPFYNDALATAQELDDETYRRLIRIKALANITRCTVPAINRLLQLMFPYNPGHVVETGPMTAAYVFAGELTDFEYAVLTQTGVVPRPAGVLVRIIQPE